MRWRNDPRKGLGYAHLARPILAGPDPYKATA